MVSDIATAQRRTTETKTDKHTYADIQRDRERHRDENTNSTKQSQTSYQCKIGHPTKEKESLRKQRDDRKTTGTRDEKKK